LDSKARVEALGGIGQQKGFGGAGGVIYIENLENNSTSMMLTFADGGAGGSYWKSQAQEKVDIGCQNGAPGTIYF